jgi:hypothetical protein
MTKKAFPSAARFDLPPRLLTPDELVSIGNSRQNIGAKAAVEQYRHNVSRLLAHITALEAVMPSATESTPRVSAIRAVHETAVTGADAPPDAPVVRVRPSMPAPGTPEYNARMRELRAAGQLIAPAPAAPSIMPPSLRSSFI